MASKPKNYKRRVIDSRGAHFRIDSGNPVEGLSGAEACKVYAESDDGDVFLIAHTQGGLSRIAADKTLEVRAGDNNDPGVADIRISVANGDIVINADRGRVRVQAKNIMLNAEQDIDISAGRNVNITGGARIQLKANTVGIEGKRGNGVPNTFGMKMFAGSHVPGDMVEAALGPFSSPSILGIAAGVVGAVAGDAAGNVANSVISATGLGGTK